jgi:hypothetical protein
MVMGDPLKSATYSACNSHIHAVVRMLMNVASLLFCAWIKTPPNKSRINPWIVALTVRFIFSLFDLAEEI